MIEWQWERWCDGDWCWYLKDDKWHQGYIEIRMEYGEFYDAHLHETNGKLIKYIDFLDIFKELRHNKPDPDYDNEERERIERCKTID